MLPSFGDCIDKLYQGRSSVSEQLQTSEWAMVGSLGNDSLSGIIPSYHRLQTPPGVISLTSAYNQRIRESGLRTQNYDKGLDRFVGKFDPGVEMFATMAVYEGHYCDHGWAVNITQEKRRCCRLQRT
jgi:hypothetical protein